MKRTVVVAVLLTLKCMGTKLSLRSKQIVVLARPLDSVLWPVMPLMPPWEVLVCLSVFVLISHTVGLLSRFNANGLVRALGSPGADITPLTALGIPGTFFYVVDLSHC
jgi:hypothetical protein